MKEDCSVFLSPLPPRYCEKLREIKYHFSKTLIALLIYPPQWMASGMCFISSEHKQSFKGLNNSYTNESH